jgi:Tol biopolymer transport system component
MRKRPLLFILAICIPLVCAICFFWRTTPGLFFFMKRWASGPDWSPDGKRIAFTCHYPSISQVLNDLKKGGLDGGELFHWNYIRQATEICTVFTDGSHFVRLTNNQTSDGEAAWSPDGRFIAYISGSGLKDYTIQIITQEGQQVVKLGEDLDVDPTKPAWSPDGKRLCFAAQDPLKPNQSVNIYIATVQTGDVQALTTLPGNELECQWSPDGKQLAFRWFPERGAAFGSKAASVWVTELDGHSKEVMGGVATIGNLAWSPDGTQLAFWASSNCVHSDDCRQIYTADLSGNSTDCLTEQHNIAVGFDVTWSPDSEQIAFTAQESEGPVVYLMTLKNQQLSQVIRSHKYDHDLVWSPTDGYIALVRGNIESERLRIWLVDVNKSSLKELNIP